jgi:molecular chaperone DnaJ
MKNYYAILGVEKNASKEEITKAYRKGAKTHHPDVNPGDEGAARRFQEIQEAYDTLSDPGRRADYDSGGMSFRSRRSGGGGSPFGDPFMDAMKDFFGGSQFRGKNLQVRLEIDLEEVLRGCRKEVSVKLRNKCGSCRGSGVESTETCSLCSGSGFVNVNNAPFEFRQTCSGCMGVGKIKPKPCSECAGTGSLPGHQEKKISVDVPAGVDSGMSIRVSGQGEESVNGGRPGDIVVYILVKDHPLYSRDGIDLLVDIPVSYTQLALGAEITVPTLAGEKLTVRIPPGSQSHGKLKLREKGLSVPSGYIGDLFVTLKLETPRQLAGEHRSKLEELAAIEQATSTPRRDAWRKIVEQGNT